jgi:hypothetical protein
VTGRSLNPEEAGDAGKVLFQPWWAVTKNEY